MVGLLLILKLKKSPTPMHEQPRSQILSTHINAYVNGNTERPRHAWFQTMTTVTIAFASDIITCHGLGYKVNALDLMFVLKS